MVIELNPEFEARLRHLAETRHTSPEALLGEALEEFLEREEQATQSPESRHPSGQPWPRRNPVGGIITPV